ncbi:MAG TPA: leukotriene A4 hydrolase C-terminal domain-containing protein, partial [Planctomycetota bacterium]|nr:leukotriene A4 hydrolase C-terminal domain-containing protein [Planctomycetota bacterium]
TEKMIAAAEDLYGPYRWERYDILVLPPSFPWGGMENPRLTFATPTILAGDRSLVALIAHELAHSWSGNLVTNATWSDFWLNEGFTVYFEHRIMEKLYGKDLDEMLAWIGYDELLADLERLPPADTSLVLPLAGRDPNDGMTAIAYEKGYFFLRTCEQVIGRARWDRFLRRYFDRFAFQSMTSEGFLSYLRGEILTNDPDLERRLDPESWIYKPGLPENVSRPEPRRLAVLDRALERFSKGASPDDLDASEWTTFDWLYFLRRLPRPADSERLAALDRAFSLTTTGNAEVACEWLILAIRSNYEPAIPRLEEFLREVGRLKFIRPLYTALEEISPSGSAIARRIYSRARSGYHPIAIKVLDSLFER